MKGVTRRYLVMSEFSLFKLCRVSDGSHNTDSSIVINVVDVNDEPPVFAPSSYTKDLLENVPSGKFFTKSQATA